MKKTGSSLHTRKERGKSAVLLAIRFPTLPSVFLYKRTLQWISQHSAPERTEGGSCPPRWVPIQYQRVVMTVVSSSSLLPFVEGRYPTDVTREVRITYSTTPWRSLRSQYLVLRMKKQCSKHFHWVLEQIRLHFVLFLVLVSLFFVLLVLGGVFVVVVQNYQHLRIIHLR